LVERIAALVALVTLAAAIVLVVYGALTSWQGTLITVIGLFVLVVAGWYVVSRRGTTRTTALLAAAVGVLLLIAGFVVADMSAARVLATTVFAIVSVGAARVALHRSERALQREARMRSPVRPAERPVLIINPKSGGGKAEKFDLVAACRERGIEAIQLSLGDDLLEVAEAAIARGADVIGMAGGDGSQALVATVAARHDVPHVVIPAGTRNHLALDLGLDRDDVVGALDAYHDGIEHRVDLATVNNRVFLNNASVGLYAKIVQRPEYRDAKRATTVAALPDLVGPNAPPLDLRFTGPDGTDFDSAQIIMVSNNPYDLHRLTGRGTRERVDHGVLGIVAARIANAGEFAQFVALEAAGQPQRFSGWIEWTARRFEVDSSGPVEIGLDGEALTLPPPLVFESRPGALRVRLPRHAIGRSPTAKSVHVLSHSTIADLVRVAGGRAMSS
jgi:diacylglycerol kinase family enzyme